MPNVGTTGLMRLSNLVERAIRRAPVFDWANVAIDVSPRVLAIVVDENCDALGERRSHVNRRVGLHIGELIVEVREAKRMPDELATVSCQAMDVWHGQLCASDRERLMFRSLVAQVSAF